VSDFFLQANLKGCGFRLLRRCFQCSGNCFAPFLFRGVVRLALQVVCSDLCTRTKHGPERLGAGGSDPTTFWAAESRTKWGRSRPSECFARVQMSPVSFTHPPFFQESAVGLWVTLELKPHLKYSAFASRHPIFCCCPRIPLPGLAR
jgi:hypothetical protein